MRINLLLVVIAGLVTLTGCVSADMVSSPGASSAFAPINASTRPGLVKYLNDGAAFVREKRREDAYRQMHDACAGQYKIDAEDSSAEGGAIINTSTGSFFAQSHYWYIQFSCVPH